MKWIVAAVLSVVMLTLAVPAGATTPAIWIGPTELAQLPTSGASWTAITTAANEAWGVPRWGDQNDRWDNKVLAGALVAARTNNAAMRAKVVTALESAVGTEGDANALRVARNVPSLVIAADVIDYRSARFDAWLVHLLDSYRIGHGGTTSLYTTALFSPNNHGTQSRAAAAAIAAHLGATDRLARIALAHRRWIGEAVPGVTLRWTTTNWHADVLFRTGINRPGARINGCDVDGVQPEDQRRAGEFSCPVPNENYVSGALGGALVAGVILHRQGLVPMSSMSDALERAAKFAALSGDDQWQRPVLRRFYGTDQIAPTAITGLGGKFMAWTDWTHG